jgi:tetratricopeptide (TPR) repeat protein
MRFAVFVVIVALAARAHADDPPADEPFITRARTLYARGDFEHAREQLLAAYELAKRPAVLFALGQVEFNLKHYREAIDYYERFTATNPDAAQAALAEQAIGAARLALARPEPPPPPKDVPPPPMRREFDAVASGLTIVGSLSLAASTISFYELATLPNDHAGRWSDYDRRIATAQTARVVGIATGVIGVAAVVGAVWRWRVHRTPVRIEVQPARNGASIVVGGTL